VSLKALPAAFLWWGGGAPLRWLLNGLLLLLLLRFGQADSQHDALRVVTEQDWQSLLLFHSGLLAEGSEQQGQQKHQQQQARTPAMHAGSNGTGTGRRGKKSELEQHHQQQDEHSSQEEEQLVLQQQISSLAEVDIAFRGIRAQLLVQTCDTAAAAASRAATTEGNQLTGEQPAQLQVDSKTMQLSHPPQPDTMGQQQQQQQNKQEQEQLSIHHLQPANGCPEFHSKGPKQGAEDGHLPQLSLPEAPQQQQVQQEPEQPAEAQQLEQQQQQLQQQELRPQKKQKMQTKVDVVVLDSPQACVSGVDLTDVSPPAIKVEAAAEARDVPDDAVLGVDGTQQQEAANALVEGVADADAGTAAAIAAALNEVSRLELSRCTSRALISVPHVCSSA
jgi:hypothetical protein